MDVGLDDIYESMAEISGIDIQKLSDMRQLEERVESNSVRPRKEGIQLFNDALKSNKPIAIVTDTFLNEQTI
jgi:predicted HAD superfamily hydrolase